MGTVTMLSHQSVFIPVTFLGSTLLTPHSHYLRLRVTFRTRADIIITNCLLQKTLVSPLEALVSCQTLGCVETGMALR